MISFSGCSNVGSSTDELEDYVGKVVKEYGIPSLSLAIWKGNQLHQAATGGLNVETDIEATSQSLYQIGSITKVMTACLVMQLVDEGLVDLDVPVKHYLRDFIIADPDATQAITVRQLLNHTNGMAGDYFPDDHGQQGNLIARYVDRCNLLPLVHPPGKLFSYSNSAFVIAGRLVEVMRGISWYQAIEDYIFKPLGLEQAIADPKDIIRHRCAAGHIYDDAENWITPSQPYHSLALAPVGATLMMTAENVIRFARAYMDGLKGESVNSWLSTASLTEMQAPQIEQPPLSSLARTYAGLGWGIADYVNHNNLRVIGHSGATKGFLSNLRLIPEQNAAFCILINGRHQAAMDATTKDLLEAVAGIDLSEPESTSDQPLNQLTQIIGTYDSFDNYIVVEQENGQLTATIQPKNNPTPPEHLTLRHTQATTFASYSQAGSRTSTIVFSEHNEQGIPQYLFYLGRQHPRVS